MSIIIMYTWYHLMLIKHQNRSLCLFFNTMTLWANKTFVAFEKRIRWYKSFLDILWDIMYTTLVEYSHCYSNLRYTYSTHLGREEIFQHAYKQLKEQCILTITTLHISKELCYTIIHWCDVIFNIWVYHIFYQLTDFEIIHSFYM